MEAHEDRKLRPLLRVFHLKSGNFSNSLTGKLSLRFGLEKDIAVELQTSEDDEEEQKPKATPKGRTRKPKEEPKPFKSSVEINLKAHFVDSEGKPVEGIVATATYRAGFEFNKEVTSAEVEQALESEPYQYLFVVQAFPLAISHFKEQLTAMGMNSSEMPLGVVA